MFNTELTIEEESLLQQILSGKKQNRAEILLNIKGVSDNTEEKEGKGIAKSLFEKIKNTSDYEYNAYRDMLLSE
jgi:hypothetical protein